MPGPRTKEEALRWIQEAVQAGRYILSRHFRGERLLERGLSMDDFFAAIERATEVVPYDRREPVNGGTCWRVFGPSLSGDALAVGVEAFFDRKRRRIVVCTIFVIGEPDEM
jgi:hypothetical protein